MKKCCGLCNLETGVKVIAVLSFIIFIYELKYSTESVIGYGNVVILEQNDDKLVDFTLWIIVTLFFIIDLILSIVLFYGAWKRRLTPVKVWFWINLVFTILVGVSVIFAIVFGDEWIGVTLECVLLIIFVYFVNEFRKELTADEANGDISVTFHQP